MADDEQAPSHPVQMPSWAKPSPGLTAKLNKPLATGIDKEQVNLARTLIGQKYTLSPTSTCAVLIDYILKEFLHHAVKTDKETRTAAAVRLAEARLKPYQKAETAEISRAVGITSDALGQAAAILNKRKSRRRQ